MLHKTCGGRTLNLKKDCKKIVDASYETIKKGSLKEKISHHFNPLNFSGFWVNRGVPRKIVKKIAPVYEKIVYKPLSGEFNPLLTNYIYSIGNMFA